MYCNFLEFRIYVKKQGKIFSPRDPTCMKKSIEHSIIDCSAINKSSGHIDDKRYAYSKVK